MVECVEFLSISGVKKNEEEEEYAVRVVERLSTWQARKASVFYDDLNTWDDILYARILFFDKVNSARRVNVEEFSEFSAL